MADNQVHLGIYLHWVIPEVSEDHLDLIITQDFHGQVLIDDSEVYHIQGLHDFLWNVSLA